MITLYAKISKYFMVLVGALLVGTIQNFFWKSLHIYTKYLERDHMDYT